MERLSVKVTSIVRGDAPVPCLGGLIRVDENGFIQAIGSDIS